MLGPAGREIWMIIGVVPNFVPFFDNSPNQIRITLGILAHQKKRRLHIGSFQNIEDLWRPFPVRTVIESNCDLMLVSGALVIEARELRKFRVLGSDIAVVFNR